MGNQDQLCLVIFPSIQNVQLFQPCIFFFQSSHLFYFFANQAGSP